MKINLGCGSDRRSGYLNIDAFTLEADLRSDLSHLSVCASSADEIYCSHVLEHLSEGDVKQSLREMSRVLKPREGRVVILVPDFAWCLASWLDLPESQKWGWAIDTIFGNQNHDGEHHRTGIKVGTVFSHGMRSIKAEAVAGGPGSRYRFKLPRRATYKVVIAKYRFRATRTKERF